jgi:hypothetical protein
MRKLCEEQQKQRETVDTWAEIIAPWLEAPRVPAGKGSYSDEPTYRELDASVGLNTAHVLIGALGFSPDKIQHRDTIRVGYVMSDLGWHSRQVRNPNGDDPEWREWRYFPPSRCGDETPEHHDAESSRKDPSVTESQTSHTDVPYTHGDAIPRDQGIYASPRSDQVPTSNGDVCDSDVERVAIQSDGSGEVIRPEQWKVRL